MKDTLRYIYFSYHSINGENEKLEEKLRPMGKVHEHSISDFGKDSDQNDGIYLWRI